MPALGPAWLVVMRLATGHPGQRASVTALPATFGEKLVEELTGDDPCEKSRMNVPATAPTTAATRTSSSALYGLIVLP